jgi:hypothetical protein
MYGSMGIKCLNWSLNSSHVSPSPVKDLEQVTQGVSQYHDLITQIGNLGLRTRVASGMFVQVFMGRILYTCKPPLFRIFQAGGTAGAASVPVAPEAEPPAATFGGRNNGR